MPGMPPFPPATPKSNAPLVIGLVAALLALCLLGICGIGVRAAMVYTSERKSPGGSAGVAGPVPSWTTPPPPSVRDTYSPPEPIPTTSAPAPLPARIGQCISVSATGDFQGIGNCNGTMGTYRVVSVDAAQNACADPRSAYITENGYRLCLELHLVRNRCYKFPTGDGWIVGAPKCKAKGTVHVIDIVPGASNGDRCTRDYRWNRWYRFTNPTVVYCVMKY
ncbi:hypothetical protein ACIBJE_27115 [Micromonospora sp. NPDC050187]|uniref:hypothetical protein n=1 Tax=Micromonospora sp. NPDC050187 TaxID=3364277 RepID=UPI0037BC6163